MKSVKWNRSAITLFMALVCLSALSACGAGAGAPSPAAAGPTQITPLYGSSVAGVELHSTVSSIQLGFNKPGPRGVFLRLDLPAGMTLGAQTWGHDAQVLHLAAPVPGGAEIGVVALPGFGGGAVSASFDVVPQAHQASMPPVGAGNVIHDLNVAGAGAGQVTLSWTQMNAGDYNFDGFVNVADLVPLAVHFGQSYDRQAAGADQLSNYWIDGNADGQLGIADMIAIGANYYSYIHGYDIKKNGALAGQMNRSLATLRPGLPPRYSMNIAGAVTDSWVVAVVDGAGVEGADSAGGVGPIDLQATLNITGLNLFSLYGVDSGAFGPTRFGLRVIEPIDIVDRTPRGRATIAAGTPTATVNGLVRGTRYLVDLIYAPVVNLATGAPKTPAGVHGASAVSPGDLVVTSVPFYLPPGDQPVQLNAQIDLLPNPAGGYFVKLAATLSTPGDDPTTLGIVENGYTSSSVTRLVYKDGVVSRDTDQNGSFDDEAQLADANRDCISESGVEQVVDDDNHGDGEREELELSGVISAFDEAAGTVTLTGVTSETTPGLPATMTLHFAETTRFEERVRTDGGDITQDLVPGTLKAGDNVEATLYALTQGAGGPADSYWMHELKRVIDNRTH
jgi:hypothetical protein